MPKELTFNLNEQVPQSHLYGAFNKNLEFVAFSQYESNSDEDSGVFSLDFFNVTFLTKNGDLYTLSPIILQKMVMKDDYLSSCFILLQDIIEDFEEEGKNPFMLKQLRMVLLEGK